MLQEAHDYIQSIVQQDVPLPIAFNAWLVKKQKRPAFMIEIRDLFNYNHLTVSTVANTIKQIKEFKVLLYSFSNGKTKIEKALICRKDDKYVCNKFKKIQIFLGRNIDKSSKCLQKFVVESHSCKAWQKNKFSAPKCF